MEQSVTSIEECTTALLLTAARSSFMPNFAGSGRLKQRLRPLDEDPKAVAGDSEIPVSCAL